MSKTRTGSRRISDWVGFIVFSVLALNTLSKMPAVGVFLMPTLAFELFVAISFLIREQPRAAVRSARARISAYGGTFLLVVFLQIAQRFYPQWLTANEIEPLRVVGAMLWLGGSLWSAYSIWYLRYAFSIEAEARRLITTGPYNFARHPVYTGYLGQYFGMWLVFPSLPFAIVLVFWVLLMADRIGHEERVLANTFPEYEDYRRRVGAILSTQFRRPVGPASAEINAKGSPSSI